MESSELSRIDSILNIIGVNSLRLGCLHLQGRNESTEGILGVLIKQELNSKGSKFSFKEKI